MKQPLTNNWDDPPNVVFIIQWLGVLFSVHAASKMGVPHSTKKMDLISHENMGKPWLCPLMGTLNLLCYKWV